MLVGYETVQQPGNRKAQRFAMVNPALALSFMNLRKAIIRWLWAVLLLSNSAAQAQLILNSGDAYTYSFNTVGYVFTDTGPSRFGWMDGADFMVFGRTSDSFQLRLEIFEDTTNGLPVVSDNFTLRASSYAVAKWGALRDLQGAVRVTVNSGTLFLESANLHVNIWGANGTEVYATALPVPEPSVFLLLGPALLVLLFAKGKSGYIARRLIRARQRQ